jgi:hypothetical protein
VQTFFPNKTKINKNMACNNNMPAAESGGGTCHTACPDGELPVMIPVLILEGVHKLFPTFSPAKPRIFLFLSKKSQ